MTNTNIQLTDKQVFNNMFKTFRKEGFIARQNYLCCQNCAWNAVESDYDADENSKIVFYHGQDAEAFEGKTLTRTLYLAWQGTGADGRKIREIIEEHGFEVDWDGTNGMRIGVKPRVEQE